MEGHPLESSEEWKASCWDADSAVATDLDLFVTFELLHTFVSDNFSLRTPDFLVPKHPFGN